MKSRIFATAGLITLLFVQPVTAKNAPDRTKPPAPGPLPMFQVPIPERFTLTGGLPVYLLTRHQAPLVDVIVVARTGAIGDPDGKRGVASATAAMLTRGAGDKGALAFADAVDFLGASLGGDASFDALTVALHVTAEHAREGMSLLADAVLRPRFEKEEWERAKAERRTQFLAWRNDPRVLGQLAVARAMWGSEHRMGYPIMGTPADLERITIDDLRTFHSERMRPDNAFLVIAGDIDKEQARQILEETFGSWAARGSLAPVPPQPARPEVAAQDVVLVDKPGAPQTVTTIAAPIPTLSDYNAPARVMITLLGGSFSSRLNQNLREEHGYTYGAFAATRTTKQGSTFAAMSSVATPVTAPAIAETLKELDRIHELASKAEVEMAQRFLGLSVPAEFETGREIAATWAHALDMNYPEQDVTGFMQRAAAVNAEDVQKAAREYVPTASRIVLVGDRAAMEKPIQDANFGPIVTWTIDELLGTPAH